MIKKLSAIALILLSFILLAAYFWMSMHPRSTQGSTNILEGDEARSYLVTHDEIEAPAQPLRVLPFVVISYHPFKTTHSAIFHASETWVNQFITSQSLEDQGLSELQGDSLIHAAKVEYLHELMPHTLYQDKHKTLSLYYHSTSGYVVISLGN